MNATLKAVLIVMALASTQVTPLFAEDCRSPDVFSFFTISLAPRFLAGNGGPNTDSCFSVNVLAGERANLTGFEIASAMNLETGSVVGVQIAGLANIVSGNATGFQFSPGVNVIGGYAHGVQMAGLLNKASSAIGFQASPGVNVAINRLSGFQLGIVNVAKSVSGLSLGLVTIEKGGILEGLTIAEISDNASLRTGIGLKVGTKLTYSAFYASIPIDTKGAFTLDAGWGIRTRLNSLIIDSELLWRSHYVMGFTQETVSWPGRKWRYSRKLNETRNSVLCRSVGGTGHRGDYAQG